MLAPGIGEEVQWATGRDLRVLLAQRPRGEVARIGIGAPAFRFGGRIEGGEGVGRGIDLAPDLHPRRPIGAVKPQWYVGLAERLQIIGDILASPAVAARGPDAEDAVDVQQAGGQAVDLGLGHKSDGLVARQLQEPGNAGHEVAYLTLIERIVQRQHGHAMAHGCELGGNGGPNGLGRAGLGGQGRETRLDDQGALLQGVIVGVRNLGRVVGVIQGVMMRQLGGQAGQLGSRFGLGQGIDSGFGHGIAGPPDSRGLLASTRSA